MKWIHVPKILQRPRAIALGLAVAVLTILGSPDSAQAGSTFASFTVNGTPTPGYVGPNQFNYVKTSTNHATFSGTESVTFSYSHPNLFSGATQTQYNNAVATLSVTQTTAGISIGGVSAVAISGTFSIKVGSLNLLTVTFDGALQRGSSSLATVIGDTSNGQNVVFTSSVLSQAELTAVTEAGIVLSLSTTKASPGISYNSTSHTYNNFQVKASGQFTATVAVPEPASLALCGTALAGACGVALRRRRRVEV